MNKDAFKEAAKKKYDEWAKNKNDPDKKEIPVPVLDADGNSNFIKDRTISTSFFNPFTGPGNSETSDDFKLCLSDDEEEED